MKKIIISLICLISLGLSVGFAQPNHHPNKHLPPQNPHHVHIKPAPKVPHHRVIVIDKPIYKPRVYVTPILPPPPPSLYVEPIIVVPEPQPIIEFKFNF